MVMFPKRVVRNAVQRLQDGIFPLHKMILI